MIVFEETLGNYLAQEIDVLKNLDMIEIEKAAALLYEAVQNQRHIYCFGNGGSASTASHLTNDFNKILNANCFCLNDNIATIMAIANDISYEEVFRHQLRGRIRSSDIIIAISGSGNSPNIINAVTYALGHGATIIGLTGYDGGKLKQLAHINLWAPINNMQITEDIHLMFNHLLVSTISKFIF